MTVGTTKTPWHLWVVGVLSLAWNAMGVWTWQQQVTRAPGYLASMTVEQVRYIDAAPVWVSVAFGLAVWAGLLGALALLLRRRLAFNAYVAGLIGYLVNSGHAFATGDAARIMGAGGMAFTALIFVLCLFEVGYSRWVAKAGVLR